MTSLEPPPELSIGETRYALDPTLVAVRKSSATETELTRAPWIAEAADLAVISTPASLDRRADSVPVYRSVPSGQIAVPTGRVFVRFDDGSRAADREPDLRAAGYRLDTSPGWAPHMAWVAAASGSAARALSALPALHRISGLAHAEPELLRRHARRDQA